VAVSKKMWRRAVRVGTSDSEDALQKIDQRAAVSAISRNTEPWRLASIASTPAPIKSRAAA
jgi:hypothetical protein